MYESVSKLGRASSYNYCSHALGNEWWDAGVVICLERGAGLHMAQLMQLPLTVSCFSKIQIDCTFLVPAHLGSPGQRAVKRACVSVCRLAAATCSSYSASDTGAKYCDECLCDECVCVCVCLSAIIS